MEFCPKGLDSFSMVLDRNGKVRSMGGNYDLSGEEVAELFGMIQEYLWENELMEEIMAASENEVGQEKIRIDVAVDGMDFQVNYLPMLDVDGNLELALFSTGSVSEEKNKESFFNSKELAIVESIGEGIGMVDEEDNLVWVNKRFAKMLDYDKEELLSKNVRDILVVNDLGKLDKENRLRKEGKTSQYTLKMKRRDGRVLDILITASPWWDDEGKFKGAFGVVTDITDQVRAEETLSEELTRKDMLLKEIHHRIKNNLQVISSLLKLQSLHVNDPKAKAMFLESRNRVNSISIIHEKLYQSENFSRILFSDYIRDLVPKLARDLKAGGSHVNVLMDLEDIYLESEMAIPCGLILNELITNAYKHAFPQGEGTIKICLSNDPSEKGDLLIRVKDDGVGFSDLERIQEGDTMGLNIISILTKQIGGKIN